MSAQLATGLIANAIVRLTQAAGGFAMILAKGDDTSGSILLLTVEKGRTTGLFERVMRSRDGYAFERVGPQDVGDSDEFDQYLARRRKNDPDLWLIELDIPEGQRFVAQLTAFD